MENKGLLLGIAGCVVVLVGGVFLVLMVMGGAGAVFYLVSGDSMPPEAVAPATSAPVDPAVDPTDAPPEDAPEDPSDTAGGSGEAEVVEVLDEVQEAPPVAASVGSASSSRSRASTPPPPPPPPEPEPEPEPEEDGASEEDLDDVLEGFDPSARTQAPEPTKKKRRNRK